MSLVRAIVGRKFRCPRGKVRNCAIYFARPRPKLVRIVSWRCRPPEVPVCGHGTGRKGREKSFGSFGARFALCSFMPPCKKKSVQVKECLVVVVVFGNKKEIFERVCVRATRPRFDSIWQHLEHFITKTSLLRLEEATLGKQDSGWRTQIQNRDRNQESKREGKNLPRHRGPPHP